MVNRGLWGSPVDIEMVGGMALSQDVTLHRVSRLGSLVMKQTLMQEAGAVDKRGHRDRSLRGNMSPIIRAGAGWQTSRNTRFRFLFRADLNTWNDRGC